MPQTSSNLSNALRARYIADYIRGAKMARVYDAMAAPIGKDMSMLKRGSSVVVNFLSDLAPATEAISEIADLTPVNMRDATKSVTPTSRANAIQVSEKLLNTSYTNYGSERFEKIGKNMMESVEVIARNVACQGSVVQRTAARASLDAGTASNRITAAKFANAEADLMTMKVPGLVDGREKWIAVMHPYVFADLRDDADITAIAQYQKANILLAYELGELGPFKLVVSPWAKVFWGAGADNASAVATTLANAETALSKEIEVASATNIAVGQRLAIGTEETGDTHYPTNELVTVISVSGTTIGIAGEGPNGGLRFDHASGVAVRNADSVGTVVFGGPMSLAKVYDTEVGEYGQVVGPKKQGLVDQFESLGWKWYGNYDRISESWLRREEVSLSRDA